MNIYNKLNEVFLYIEKNLEEEIDRETIARIIGCNQYTLVKIFTLLTGYSLQEYIRYRKLTVAAIDLMSGQKVIDVAIKYGYSSPISFSHAFKQMYHITPRDLKYKDNKTLQLQPILFFNVKQYENTFIKYQVLHKEQFNLFGVYIDIGAELIPPNASKLWSKMKKNPWFIEQPVQYGVVEFQQNQCRYWCCIEQKVEQVDTISIPEADWLIFTIHSREGTMIKDLMEQASNLYIPSIHKKVNRQYALEKYYHDYVEVWMLIY